MGKQKHTTPALTPIPTKMHTPLPVDQSSQATPSYEDLSVEVNKSEDRKPETWEAPVAKVVADVEQTNKKLEKMNDVLIFGVIVILIMVATIIITVLLDYKNSYNQLTNQRFDLLEQRLPKLENSPEPTSQPSQTNEKESTPIARPR